MTFDECVMTCYDNKELVAQFDRLNAKNPGRARTDEERLRLFVAFVLEVIWLPLATKASKEAA